MLDGDKVEFQLSIRRVQEKKLDIERVLDVQLPVNSKVFKPLDVKRSASFELEF